ncbi:MAG: glycosyltransferase [Candidatus Acidiferrales bacterium]
MTFFEYVALGICAIPFIYYLLALYGTVRFFAAARVEPLRNSDFAPQVSCLKPIRSLNVDAYQNFASFCVQDYPEYEILFCVDRDDPAVPVLNKIVEDFPRTKIRLLYGSSGAGINDKVARLVRLSQEAKYDLFVISDADVRVGPDYLKSVVAPFRDSQIGAATTLYASTPARSALDSFQSVSMLSDFFAGIMVDWNLEEVKFTFGQTIVATRKAISGFGGYQAIANKPADDLLVGRLIAEQGYKVDLLPYVVQTVPDFSSWKEFLLKRIRWMTVMRFMRPWGHVGLIFTWGLIWALIAIAAHPTLPVAIAYLCVYLILRVLMTWLIGSWGMKQRGVWKKLPLIPLWDLFAFSVWLASFATETIRWGGKDFRIRQGKLVPVEADGPRTAAAHQAPNPKEI